MNKRIDLKNARRTKLDALMKQHGISNAELGKVLGIDQSTVWRWRLDYNMRAEHILLLANYFKVEPIDLFGYVD
jgi:transcriptional regulator with XRE-family HTH domain